jgi:hypothetical protein
LPKPVFDVMMREPQGEAITEKQPNSRTSFVCGIDNPIGPKLEFCPDDEGRCIARSQPQPERQGYPFHLHRGMISTLLSEATNVPPQHRRQYDTPLLPLVWSTHDAAARRRWRDAD